jgi:hypothetical protein
VSRQAPKMRFIVEQHQRRLKFQRPFKYVFKRLFNGRILGQSLLCGSFESGIKNNDQILINARLLIFS